ncbi:MAG: hypothetical protein FJ015_04620 [Chloroflexi bacterium]|nr:hypothetical protein [Chloroflexota bacterium]
MTHTLHRRGTRESLSEDYVMLCLPAVGVNNEGHAPKLKKFLEIATKYDPVNIGTIKLGNMYSHSKEEVVKAAEAVVHAVFVKQGQVADVLKDLEKADLGMSVVVSGIFEKVDECLKKAGLKHHTANFSLGIWGKTERLPSNEILEVTTMCGHAMVAANLVREMVKEIKAGTKTPEDAAKVLAPQCACGIFNPARAAKLMAAMAAK